MLLARPEGYVGKQKENCFIEQFFAGNFYGVVSLDGINDDEGKKLIDFFKQGLLSGSITDLTSFENTISSLILKLNFPVHVGMSIGMHFKDALYLKTVGDGIVYFRRGKEVDVILTGDKIASGFINTYDLAIFTTEKISDVIGTTEDLSAFIRSSKPSEIIEKIHHEDYGEDEMGFAVLFVEFGPVSNSNSSLGIQADTVSEFSESVGSVVISENNSLRSNERTNSLEYSNKYSKYLKLITSKKMTIIAALALLIILTWSVVFGHQRRLAAIIDKQVTTATEQVKIKLSEAEDEAFLNIDKSTILITDAKKILEDLKKNVGEGKASEILQIQKLIDEAEKSIMKKEDKDFEQFYDLTLENELATGEMFTKDGELVAILDAKQQTIYTLDVSNKSITEYVDPDVSNAVAVGLFNEDVYFITPSKGVMKFTTQSKVRTIIEADKDWGNIIDMKLFNGNIYLLDSKSDEIYKYLVTENGYSDKVSYFNSGQAANLSNATSFVIDSAVYISAGENIYKYLSGDSESFSPKFPEENVSYDDVYTDGDIESVYVLDKAKGSVYVLSKDGTYEKQISSSIFTKSKGIYVYENKIHALSGSVIYSISLE